MPIRIRAILVILLTNLVIILFSVYAGTIYVRNSVEKSQETDLMMVADIADHYISSEIELLKLKAAGAAQNLAAFEDAELPEILANRETPDFIGLAVLDADKGLIASAGKLPAGPELMDDKYIKQAFGGGKTFSSTIPSSHGVVFYLAVPMTEARILAVTIPGMHFAKRLSTFVIWQTGHVFIDDAEGHVIANMREEWVQNRINFLHMSENDKQYEGVARVIRRAVSGETGVGHFSVSGVPRICAYRPVSGSGEGWVLGVIAPLPESPFRNLDRGLVVVGLVGFILNVFAAIIASNFIKKPFEEVAALKEAAEAHSKSKSDFLANMSHEIRTPMNAMLGITEILARDESLAADTREALNMIYNSGDLLIGIINDILDLSKIEAGKLELTPSRYEVASLINDAVVFNTMRIGHKPVEFKVYVDENAPSALFGDELRIKQILNNLLSNAFKYTEKGEVRLSIDVETEGEKSTLVFKVSDTGRGMTEEQLKRLFDEYARFDADANRTTEGTGLGMSITQKLVSLMNGVVSVESALNQGSAFTVRLPQGNLGSGQLGKEVAENLRNFSLTGTKQIKRAQMVFEPMPYGHILVVDDVESNLYVAKGLLAPYGLSVDTAMSGLEAIEKIKNGQVYDLVFMDHMMPEMDGIEATRIIRGLGYTGAIAALTANAVVGQSDMFLANGFDDFISKPIDVRHLNAALKKYVRDKQPPEVIEAAQKKGAHVEAGEAQPPAAGAHLAEIFVRDAAKACATLEAMCEKRQTYGDEDLRLYTINTHAMKSALANIDEGELSAFAAKLERAGRDKDMAVISAETPALLTGLRALIEKLTPPEEEEGGTADVEYLRERLLAVKEACEVYDKRTAKEAINELRGKTWPRPTRELLAKMAEHLLNGDFEEVSNAAEKIIIEAAWSL